MKNHSHIEVSSWIVILGILTILTQFTAYYFFSSVYIVVGISSLALIICTHILLEQSQSYESSFIYALLTIFISLVITLLTYFGKEQEFIPYTDLLIGIVALNWFIPTLHCYIRDMFGYSTRVENFKAFFRNSSIIFILFYTGLLIYASFARDAFPWAYRAVAEQANFTPFWSLATQIEDYLYKMIPISDIFSYLGSRIFIYLPYGYYITLLLRRQTRVLRFVLLLFLPVIIELLQFILIPTRCDIDDIIYAFIGGLFGALWFYLNNFFFRMISGKNFLAKNSDYRYSKSSLHF